MTPYSEQPQRVLEELKSDQIKGLTAAEAKQRLEQHGPNQLEGKKTKSLAARFLEQLKDPMIIVLLVAAAINFVIAFNGHDGKEFFEPLLILAIVIANAIMGVSQESKAEKALEALQEMSAPSARVIRDGVETIVESNAVVPGDIILIEAGDFIPADGRLLDSASLKCEESALTGESVPSDKEYDEIVAEDAPLGDRHNMVYSGCSVAYGRGRYIVTATGMQTEMGRIADMLNDEGGSATPLQQKLAKLSKMLGIAALAICLVIF